MKGKKEPKKCEHLFSYGSLGAIPVWPKKECKFAHRTCVNCGLHQQAKLNWMTRYKKGA